MKTEGFTLVELLGVVIIISIILLLTFPTILKVIKDKSEKLDNTTKELIYNAADLVVRENSNIYLKSSNATYCITISELINYGYLVDNVNINKESIKNTNAVEIIYSISNNNYEYYNNQFGFELIEINECNLIKIKNGYDKCKSDNKCSDSCVNLSLLKNYKYIGDIYDKNGNLTIGYYDKNKNEVVSACN